MKNKTRQRLVLTISLMSYLLAALDNSLVLTSLLKIKADLGLNQVSLSWIQDAYGLAFGSLILLSGKLGDIWGRKVIMEVALGLFAVSSLVTAGSTNVALTIASRFVQGMGAALMAPTALALLIDYFEGPALTRAIAWYSSIAGIGMSIGLLLGGTLAGYFTWRAGFYLNAMIALALFILSWIALERKQGGADSRRLDIMGALLSVLGSGLLVYGVNGAHHMLTFLLAAVVIFAGLAFTEGRVEIPVLPLGLLKDRTRLLAYLSRGVLVAATMGYSFFNSEYLLDYLHFSPLLAGIGYLPLTITLFVMAMFVTRLIGRYGNSRMLMAGSVAIMLGFAWATAVGTGDYWQVVLGPEMLIGLGQGLALAPQTNLGIYQVRPDESGAASGVLNMFHQLGGVLGIAVMVQAGISIAPVKGMGPQFHEAMIVGLVLTLGLVVITSLFKKIE